MDSGVEQGLFFIWLYIKAMVGLLAVLVAIAGIQRI